MMARMAVAVAVLSSLSWAQTDSDDFVMRVTAPLAQAGIALDDEAALIRALQRSDNPRLASSAAYALGRLPRTELSVRELTVATLAEDEILMNYSIRALLRLGDTQWVNIAKGRLRNIKNSVQRLELAGELAQGGVFDGWDLVASAVTNGDFGHRDIGLRIAGSFRQMKDASGKPVLIEKLDEMRIGAPQPVRDALLAKIIELTVEPATPVRRENPRK
jgi:hypothetical protein